MVNHPNRSTRAKLDWPIVNERQDGKIGDGVYIAYQLIGDVLDRNLDRIWIGTSMAGPILEYVANGDDRWDGYSRRYFVRGAWTSVYSRGNYGKNYACGGNWSGHTLNLIGEPQKPNINLGDQIMLGNQFYPALKGIRGDIGMYEIPCDGAWGIWYASARAAMQSRLTPEQIQASALPQKTKVHLAVNETQDVLANVDEVINAYDI